MEQIWAILACTAVYCGQADGNLYRDESSCVRARILSYRDELQLKYKCSQIGASGQGGSYASPLSMTPSQPPAARCWWLGQPGRGTWYCRQS